MKSFIFLLNLILITTISTPLLAANLVGIKEFTITSSERKNPLPITLWYPAETGGEKVLIGDNKVFKGRNAFKNAPLAKGQFPLIVISHGSGNNIQNMSWLTTKLVEEGFIVAGPNHPGTTTGDSLPLSTPKIWERTHDITTLITMLTTDPVWQHAINQKQIGVLGFSLGGATALELVGARANLEAYASYCDTYKMEDCAWYAGGKGYSEGEAVAVEPVNLRNIDKTRFEQSNLDQRIKTAVVIDPGLAQAFDADSLKNITQPITFINLGQLDTIPASVIANTLATLSPNSDHIQINEAVHFSFLAECKKEGADFLKSIGDDDLLCEDGGARPRSDIHTELQETIANAFIRTLKEK